MPAPAFGDRAIAQAAHMGVSHLSPGAIFESALDLDAVLEARIDMLRALVAMAIERNASAETVSTIRERLMEAEAELEPNHADGG